MLRALTDMVGYRIAAEDGEVGKVRDFYFDDQEWTMRYLVADTGKWLPGRLVLISPVSLGPTGLAPAELSGAANPQAGRGKSPH